MPNTTIVMTNGQERKEVVIASLEQDRLLNTGWTVYKKKKPGPKKL